MKPRLLDLFCGAGGAAMGYSRAGFDVVGVDIKPQSRYPFEFVQADALDCLRYGYVASGIDAIHASPPCQAFTDLKSMANAKEHPDLIGTTRELLRETGLPYVIENVSGAPLLEPFKLCGSSFGLGVDLCIDPGTLQRLQLWRHRLFETNWPIGMLPPCSHQGRTCGVYGDHFRLGRRSSMGEFSGPYALELGSHAMGIDWMTWDEIREAIPPAYTELIGHQLMQHLRALDNGAERSPSAERTKPELTQAAADRSEAGK